MHPGGARVEQPTPTLVVTFSPRPVGRKVSCPHSLRALVDVEWRTPLTMSIGMSSSPPGEVATASRGPSLREDGGVSGAAPATTLGGFRLAQPPGPGAVPDRKLAHDIQGGVVVGMDVNLAMMAGLTTRGLRR